MEKKHFKILIFYWLSHSYLSLNLRIIFQTSKNLHKSKWQQVCIWRLLSDERYSWSGRFGVWTIEVTKSNRSTFKVLSPILDLCFTNWATFWLENCQKILVQSKRWFESQSRQSFLSFLLLFLMSIIRQKCEFYVYFTQLFQFCQF